MMFLYVYLAVGAVTALLFHLEAERALGLDPDPECVPCRDNRAFFRRIVGDLPVVTPAAWGLSLLVAAVVWPLSVFIVVAPASHRPFCPLRRRGR
ncbi:hypothetical protein KIK06_04290 [Nocardiopsis sp. EMB25]|uniref:hypothetical protein n=1 Tax=Nocardiopsis sp. EMB25 TaxID=2835867 RepID=UPI002283BB98|nr:hypothetical protein [Nocardiopsis sp. EMB25]MCY9783109.1 hypothetical protein [Nocardiopsis sp. EMB25]